MSSPGSPALRLLAFAFWSAALSFSASAGTGRPPNVVIVFTDDQGYADIGPNGAEGFSTPNLDRMAREGRLFPRWYAAQPVCSASRAALLTGCYPNRIGIHGALSPGSRVGIATEETTLAEMFRSKGYATAIFGKWHLGDHETFLPLQHGFDEFFGIPYSNDMWPQHPTATHFPPLPLYEGNERLRAVDERDQRMMTSWITARAVDFICRNRERPFFLYVPHPQPHVPLHVSGRFAGTTERGLYGDVVAELDWSLGEIINAIDTNDLAGDTLVVFASDNGPWLSYGSHSGSAGPLREGKGTVWEGGVRTPCAMRWPGRIPAGTICDEPAMNLDLLPTFAGLVGASLPERPIDGKDILPLLVGAEGAKSPHDAYWFYYRQNELHAVLAGNWKLVLPHRYRSLPEGRSGDGGKPVAYRQAETGTALYDLLADPAETNNLAESNPEKLAELMTLAEVARAELGDRLTNRKGTGNREPGRLDDAQAADLERGHWPEGRKRPE